MWLNGCARARSAFLGYGAVVAWVVGVTARVEGAAPGAQYTVASTTVRDNRTGLLWQRSVPSSSYTWDAAKTYCAGLNLGGFATGWRLPTYKELLSIVDWRSKYPAIDATAFPCTPADFFWSSNPHPNQPSFAWGVDFRRGSTYYSSYAMANRIRCVR